MRPSDKEIEEQVNSIYERRRKLYRHYKIKSFFGLPGKGLNESNSLILSEILEKNKNENFSFVVVNNIDKTDKDYINDYHKKALRIDENGYVSIFFKVSERFGDFVIGKNILSILGAESEKKLRKKFTKQVIKQNYMKATEELIKGINRLWSKTEA